MTESVRPDTAALAALIVEIEAQEIELRFRRFTNADAWDLGSLLVTLGTERVLPITIDIRRSGQQLFHAALDGTVADNDEWINRKVRVVNRFGCSSYLLGRRLEATGGQLDHGAGVHPSEYAPHGGAFPIRIFDVGVVGSIAVSGLPQQDDHALVVEAVRMFLATTAA